MLTFNVYDRLFFVRGDEYGTAFTVDVDGKQYLVSARHVFGNNPSIDSLKVFHEQTWKTLSVSFVGCGHGEIDITVVAPKIRLSPDISLEPSVGGFVLGQDVFFVGFPYKMWANGGTLMYGRPLPFIKKGTLSSALDPTDDVKRLYVDAINNEGFSGGPLVFSPLNTVNYQVIGVVSKFKVEYERVIDKQDNDTGLRVAYNTGFMVAYSMKHALDIIRSNPIGFSINVEA